MDKNKKRVVHIVSLGVLLTIYVIMLSISTITINKENVSFFGVDRQVFIPILFKPKLPIKGVEVYSPRFDIWGQYYNGDILKYTTHMVDIIPEPLTLPDWTKADGVFQNDDLRYGGFHGSPYWMNGGQPTCKLPLPEFWELWVSFVIEGIERYDLNYISVWTEPDSPNTGSAYYYGCLGWNHENGVEYAEFYNYVYSQVKPRFPDVQILAGEISTPDWDFFQGFLDTVDIYDGVAFHGYMSCSDFNYGGFDRRIEQLTVRTGGKPLWLSEVSVITSTNEDSFCYENSPEVEQMQVDLYKIVERDARLSGFNWFTLEDSGWRYSGMMRRSRCKPVCCYYNEMIECDAFP